MRKIGKEHMKDLSITTTQLTKLIKDVIEHDYTEKVETTTYVSYKKRRGDSIFITHSTNVIRTDKDNTASKLMKAMFGLPNGRTSEAQADKFDAWFFNGYQGKRGTSL